MKETTIVAETFYLLSVNRTSLVVVIEIFSILLYPNSAASMDILNL